MTIKRLEAIRKYIVPHNSMNLLISDEDLKEVGRVLSRRVEVLKNIVEFHTVGNPTFNNLTKSAESRVSHLRPHARDASDVTELSLCQNSVFG